MLWPLVAYFAFAVVLVAAVLIVSYLLGQRHSEPATGEPYEGGIVSEGSARVRFSVRYYLVTMFFVVFDLEAVFLFAWAGAARELGWAVGPQERGGLSDGNQIWDAVPTLDGLGPWGDNDHCSERSADGSKLPEYVLASSFVPKAMLNVAALLKLLRTRHPRFNAAIPH